MSPRVLAILLAACSTGRGSGSSGGGGGGGDPGGGGGSSTPPAQPRCHTLVAVTYNVRFDNPDDGPHRWSARVDQVGDQIHLLAPDLLGTQEVLPNQLTDLVARLPGYAHEATGRDGARGGEATPLFWRADRFTREDGGTFWLSDTPERARTEEEPKPHGTWLNRIATWARLRDRASGTRLLVVNTHFDHAVEQTRRDSAVQIAAFVAAHPADHTIVMGDLNTRPGSIPYTTLKDALPDAADRASDVVRAPGLTSVTKWTELGTTGHHIDHVFVSPRLEVERYEVVDRRLRYGDADRYPSDHLPVAVRLCVPPAT